MDKIVADLDLISACFVLACLGVSFFSFCGRLVKISEIPKTVTCLLPNACKLFNEKVSVLI